MDPLRGFGFLLKDVSRLYSMNFERHASGLNLTLAQCKVLTYLQRHEGVSQARLAFLTETDPMTLVRILDHMQAQGLVERRPDPADRRARRLYLQAAALPVLKKIWRVSDRARAEAFSRMPAADRALLLRLMQQLRDNLGALLPNGTDMAAAAPAKRRGRAGIASKSAVRMAAAKA